jgi:hypothetical protein
VVEPLPSKNKALSSNPSAAKKKKGENPLLVTEEIARKVGNH